MSDIASPILAVMDNEAHAFICFCGIMKRLGGNFRPDGQLMSLKFQHLKLLLQHSDPEFYSYLLSRGADDLFFCYRWLLLELKREFAFNDALRMLEITWSSLPPDPPETEVELLGPPSELDQVVLCKDEDKDAEDAEDGDRAKEQRRHMLRPSRSRKGSCVDTGDNRDTHPFERQASFGEFKYYTTRTEEGVEVENLQHAHKAGTAGTRRQSTVESEEDLGERTPLIRTGGNPSSPASSPSFRLGLPVWKTSAPMSSLPSSPPVSWPGAPPEAPHTFPRSSATGIYVPSAPSLRKSESLCYAHRPPQASSPGRGQAWLPPPQEFGQGNPFMLFLCLSILLEHRDHIMKNLLDYNELAMHFDRLVRRHNLGRVLQRAKALFADYLHSEIWDSEEGDEVGSDSPTSAASPCSTYELATTIPSPAAQVCYSSTL